MELLIVDPFEAVPTMNLTSGNVLMLQRYLSYVFSVTSGEDEKSRTRGALVEGDISKRMLAVPYYQHTGKVGKVLIDTSATQSSSKAAWHFAARVTAQAGITRRLFDCPLGSSGYEYLTLSDTGVLTFLGQSAQINYQSDVWNVYEITIDLDEGEFEVAVDNVPVISDTHNYNELRNLWQITTTAGSTSHIYIDDIVHLGGTTGPFTDRLGPVSVTRAPLLSATETNFTPVGAATNIDAVNKTTLSEDAFNRSPASNNKADLFKLDMSAIPNDKDIIAISNQLLYRKSDIGPRNLGIVSKYGANIEREELPTNLGVFGGHAPQIITELPGGGSLDYGEVEDMEFGYEVKA